MKRNRRVLAQLPTGGGKTAVATHIAESVIARGNSAWFVCHRDELITQTSLTFGKFGLNHSFVASGRRTDLRQPLQLCGIETLKNRLIQLPRPKLVIWDECHHLAAAGWRKVQDALPDAFHLGLSATPVRSDRRGLDEYFDEMVNGPEPSWLIDEGYLSDYRAFAPSTPDLSGIRKSGDDISTTGAEAAMRKPKLVGDAVSHWRKLARGLRTVGFCVSIKHSQFMAATFNAAGIPAAHLDGNTPEDERKRVIRDFADGKILVLFNVDLFGEGFDLSAVAQKDVTIDCVIQLRPTYSLGLHLQQLGRALRPAPGKIAILIDHAGNIARHGLPDDERAWTLEGGATAGTGSANDNGPPPPVTCSGCFNQVRRPIPRDCPHCHAPLHVEAKPPEVAEGDLEEIKREDEQRKRSAKFARLKEQGEAETMAELVALAIRRGYKSPQQWAFKIWSSPGRVAKRAEEQAKREAA